MKKYELTDDTVQIFGKTLHRIKALCDFGDVKAGDLGGYIESESNLSHDGNAWVYDNAKVSGDAWVYDNAKVFGNAWVYDNAKVFGNAWVSGDAKVFGNAWVYDNAKVFGNAWVSGDAKVFGNAWVSGNAWVYGNAEVYDNAWVSDNARVFGNAILSSDAWVYGNAEVYDNAKVSGDAKVSGNAAVHEPSDIALVKGFGSEFRTTSFFRCADGRVRCRCGCFYGTVDDFRVIVSETHGDSKYAKEYLMIADLMELHFKED